MNNLFTLPPSDYPDRSRQTFIKTNNGQQIWCKCVEQYDPKNYVTMLTESGNRLILCNRNEVVDGSFAVKEIILEPVKYEDLEELSDNEQ